jgi:hypothetical protein
MADLLTGVRMTTATTGTGTMTLGSAISGYLTPALAGAVDGKAYLYGIKDGANSEWGIGTYTAAGTTLTRVPYKSTNSNAAISLSGSAEVYLTPFSSDGGDLLHGTSNPMLGFDMPLNLQLNASVASNLLTIAVKGNNGSDPSNTNPVLVPFRDVTTANGDPSWIAITSALSIDTHATGATFGTASANVPFRLWVAAFNDGGTVKLALWQSVTGGGSPTGVAALNEGTVATSAAISGSSTSPGTFYTAFGVATVSSKAFRILGYVDYAGGLTTAGTYASAPTTVQLFGPGVRKPGDVLNQQYFTTTSTTSTSASYAASSLTKSIAPSAAPNLVRGRWSATGNSSAAGFSVFGQMRRGTSTNVGVEHQVGQSAGTQNVPGGGLFWDAPGTTSSTSYTLYVKDNGSAGSFPTAEGGELELEEIMA